MKRIVICSYFFYPEQRPRAFRAFELAKQFVKDGNQVEVLIPEKQYDYTRIYSKYGFRVTQIVQENRLGMKSIGTGGIKKRFPGADNISRSAIVKKRVKALIRNLYLYLFGEIQFGFSKYLSKVLRGKRNDFDIVVSVGLPFAVHRGVYKALRKKPGTIKTKIADYGDPFYFNPVGRKIFLHKKIEKSVLAFFDYVLVPEERARKAYSYYNIDKKIRVIPQGVDYSEIKTADDRRNGAVATFAYAGNFYRDIRNPRSFFEFLKTRKEPFEFQIYTDIKNGPSFSCIKEYIETDPKRFVLKKYLPRFDCIYELSKCDFLVNIENKGGVQVPSKLIDYGLAGRPVLSFSQDNFDPEIMKEFLLSNYRHQLKVEIEKYDIKNIAKKILDLQ